MAEENKISGLQTLQFIVTLATIISALAFLHKLFGRDQADEEHDATEAAAARARQQLYKATPPSFSDDVYRDWADVLDTALLRDATENEDAVYSVFNDVRTTSDVAKIIEAFGHRRQMFTTYDISLPQAIATMFSPGEKFKLNNILRKKRISYRFK